MIVKQLIVHLYTYIPLDYTILCAVGLSISLAVLIKINLEKLFIFILSLYWLAKWVRINDYNAVLTSSFFHRTICLINKINILLSCKYFVIGFNNLIKYYFYDKDKIYWITTGASSLPSRIPSRDPLRVDKW